METNLLIGLLASTLLPALRGGIQTLSDQIWGGLIDVFTTVGLPAVTLWILINGYMILTGSSKEPLGAYILKSGKVFLWMLLATGSAAFSGTLQDNAIQLRDASTDWLTGTTVGFWATIQLQMAGMTTAGAFLGLASGNSASLQDPGVGATMATLGSVVSMSTPIVVVGITGLTLEAAILIGAALAPLFFFMGIFSKFADWPIVWIKYMLATIMTASVMAAMSIWGLAAYVAMLVAGGVSWSATGGGLLQVSAIMVFGSLLISFLMITIPGLVSRTFSQMGIGAASNQLGDVMKGASSRSGASGASGGAPRVGNSTNINPGR
jgi:type IV secretion system protein VirB6